MRAFFALPLACLSEQFQNNPIWPTEHDDFSLVNVDLDIQENRNSRIDIIPDGFGFERNKEVNDNHREIVNEEFLQGIINS